MQFSKIPIFYYWYSGANSVEFFKRSGRHRAVFCSAMRFWGARRGTPRRYEDRLRHLHRRRGPLNAMRRFLIAKRRAASRQRPTAPTWPCGPPPRGGEASDRMRAYGGANGRGNLRENREDPAPTVGHCDPHRAQRASIAAAFTRVPCHSASPHGPVVLKRRGTLRRYGLRIIASA